MVPANFEVSSIRLVLRSAGDFYFSRAKAIPSGLRLDNSSHEGGKSKSMAYDKDKNTAIIKRENIPEKQDSKPVTQCADRI